MHGNCVGLITGIMEVWHMYFEEKDVELKIDGMGIVFYSPQTNKDIPVGYDFLG